MKTVLYTCVVIPIELHPSGMYASAGPDFGGVTLIIRTGLLIVSSIYLCTCVLIADSCSLV